MRAQDKRGRLDPKTSEVGRIRRRVVDVHTENVLCSRSGRSGYHKVYAAFDNFGNVVCLESDCSRSAAGHSSSMLGVTSCLRDVDMAKKILQGTQERYSATFVTTGWGHLLGGKLQTKVRKRAAERHAAGQSTDHMNDPSYQRLRDDFINRTLFGSSRVRKFNVSIDRDHPGVLALAVDLGTTATVIAVRNLAVGWEINKDTAIRIAKSKNICTGTDEVSCLICRKEYCPTGFTAGRGATNAALENHLEREYHLNQFDKKLRSVCMMLQGTHIAFPAPKRKYTKKVKTDH